MAAMMGLIGSKLGDKLAKLPSKNPEYTQLWVLRRYFCNAIVIAVLTIISSSVILLFPEIPENEPMSVTYTATHSAIIDRRSLKNHVQRSKNGGGHSTVSRVPKLLKCMVHLSKANRSTHLEELPVG